jgi:hypothetical protein
LISEKHDIKVAWITAVPFAWASEGTVPTTRELREESRLWLQAAMAKSSRTARHRLARQALELARLAAKIENGGSLTKSEVALAAAMGIEGKE